MPGTHRRTTHVQVTTGASGRVVVSNGEHEPIVRLQAAGKYTVRCGCGWKAKGTHASSQAARDAWSEHLAPDEDLFTTSKAGKSKPIDPRLFRQRR